MTTNTNTNKFVLKFDVVGAKHESNGELNYKYCTSTNTLEDAAHAYNKYAKDYLYNFLRLVVYDDVGRERFVHTLEGDPHYSELEHIRLRMQVENTYCLATGKSSVEADADVYAHLEEIDEVLRTRAVRIGTLETRLAKLSDAYRVLEESNDKQYLELRDANHELTDANYRIKELEAKAKPSQLTNWHEIRDQFQHGLLTHTETFQALMCHCGFSMEDALKCFHNFSEQEVK